MSLQKRLERLEGRMSPQYPDPLVVLAEVVAMDASVVGAAADAPYSERLDAAGNIIDRAATMHGVTPDADYRTELARRVADGGSDAVN